MEHVSDILNMRKMKNENCTARERTIVGKENQDSRLFHIVVRTPDTKH